MAGPRLADTMSPESSPVDTSRMFWGGFEVIVAARSVCGDRVYPASLPADRLAVAAALRDLRARAERYWRGEQSAQPLVEVLAEKLWLWTRFGGHSPARRKTMSAMTSLTPR